MQATASGDGGYDAFMQALKSVEAPLGLHIPKLLDYEVRHPARRQVRCARRNDDSVGRGMTTRGVDTDQLAAAIQATEHALNVVALHSAQGRRRVKKRTRGSADEVVRRTTCGEESSVGRGRWCIKAPIRRARSNPASQIECTKEIVDDASDVDRVVVMVTLGAVSCRKPDAAAGDAVGRSRPPGAVEQPDLGFLWSASLRARWQGKNCGSSHKCVHDSAPAGRPRRGKRVRMRSCQLTSGEVVCRSVDGRLRGPRF